MSVWISNRTILKKDLGAFSADFFRHRVCTYIISFLQYFENEKWLLDVKCGSVSLLT